MCIYEFVLLVHCEWFELHVHAYNFISSGSSSQCIVNDPMSGIVGGRYFFANALTLYRLNTQRSHRVSNSSAIVCVCLHMYVCMTVCMCACMYACVCVYTC